MFIGIDASRANNENKTGVEWYAWHLIQELKQIIPAANKVILYTREPLRGELSVLPSHWEEKVLRWPPRRLWTQVRLSWELFCNPPDALFVPAHVLPLIHPAHTVITIHDLGGVRFPAGYSAFERWYAKISTRAALRGRKTRIITPSHFTAQELAALFGVDLGRQSLVRIKVIYNGYDADLFHLNIDKDSVIRTERRYGLGDLYVMSISRLEEKKNTLGIIKGFELWCDMLNREHAGSSKKWQLLLLGKPGYGYADIICALKQSPYRAQIVCPGWVGSADVPLLMKGAFAFVFPSFYEGFGIPAVEAMAVGTPVIASYSGALPEVCSDAALYVNPFKPAEIVKQMRLLEEDVLLRTAVITAGFARAKLFSWKTAAQGIATELMLTG